jgi:microcystin-dependent protein
MNAYIGDIRLFAGNYAPEGWMLCNGALLSISQFDIVFSVIGTTYGGDGVTSFALPDLRGRLPVGQGDGPGLTSRVLGQSFGSETVTLLATQIPAHSHSLAATAASATATTPAGNLFAQNGTDTFYTQLPSTDPVPQQMNPASVQLTGGGQAHENTMPTTAINYIMCVNGIYPSRS